MKNSLLVAMVSLISTVSFAKVSATHNCGADYKYMVSESQLILIIDQEAIAEGDPNPINLGYDLMGEMFTFNQKLNCSSVSLDRATGSVSCDSAKIGKVNLTKVDTNDFNGTIGYKLSVDPATNIQLNRDCSKDSIVMSIVK